MTVGIKRQLRAAIVAVDREISSLASGGMYARGTASEGYMGGYYDALNDVALALNGVEPNRWERWRELSDSAKAAGGDDDQE